MSQVEHLFVSDVHIGAFSGKKALEIENRLLSLIQYAIDHKARLYILGDLFDYWMEYPSYNYVPEIGKTILNKFEEYNKSVASAIFVTGNHDNWTFGHFAERGFDVESKYRKLSINDSKVLIMHGDGKVGKRDDILRPAFHKFLRNPTFTNIYQKIFPPNIGVGIMKNFSGFSARNNFRNPTPLNNHARDILSSEPIDYLLCGHDHIPRVGTYTGGTYINLGTFYEHKTLVRYINNEFQLVIWLEDSKEFVPYGSNIS